MHRNLDNHHLQRDIFDSNGQWDVSCNFVKTQLGFMPSCDTIEGEVGIELGAEERQVLLEAASAVEAHF